MTQSEGTQLASLISAASQYAWPGERIAVWARLIAEEPVSYEHAERAIAKLLRTRDLRRLCPADVIGAIHDEPRLEPELPLVEHQCSDSERRASRAAVTSVLALTAQYVRDRATHPESKACWSDQRDLRREFHTALAKVSNITADEVEHAHKYGITDEHSARTYSAGVTLSSGGSTERARLAVQVDAHERGALEAFYARARAHREATHASYQRRGSAIPACWSDQ